MGPQPMTFFHQKNIKYWLLNKKKKPVYTVHKGIIHQFKEEILFYKAMKLVLDVVKTDIKCSRLSS